ncbi:probable cytochrome P450 6d5-like [Musca domestica]|uniref:Cytochrome P450-6D8 n=1 Tax=Musca domestica TaxID=7370 RepID=C4PAX2_MUSDO|nr:probable cytochrome P450 6d5-like [Musca domestica]ACR19218.1 cytochrome P450-6D8 [Musca domestica]
MFLYIIIAVCSAILFYFKWCYSYWQRHGYPYIPAQVPFGVLDPVVRTWKKSVGMAIYDIYEQTREHKVVGMYLINRPALLVRDAQLARDMLTKDFASFHDRGIYVDEIHDPMSGGIFFLKGQQWKTLRTKLAPSFTSGKLRGMFDTIHDVSLRMVDHLNGQLPEREFKQIEVKHLFVTYAIDIIASSIFGLDVDSFSDPQNEFFKLSRNVNENSYRGVFRGTCQFMYPGLEKIFQRLGWTEPAPDYMKKIVRQTIEKREKHNIVRKDMLQLLLQLRNTGKINGDEDEGWSAVKTTDALASMSIELIAAQLFLFYVAGFETSAATAAFTIYELARNAELLEKAQEDVEQALAKHGSLSYDSLKDMKFLDLCVMETTRKYPGLPILNRECTKDYPLPDSELVVKKGTPIIISLFGIHRDEEYFPDALRYDPYRFEKENYNAAAYMPFGEGPRHCIAQRMGKLNVKVGVAQILQHFEVKVDPSAPEIEFDNFGLPIMPKGGVPVTLAKKQKTNVIKS